MSDSARTTKPRIVPAIPLNLVKPPSAKTLATPEGSEPSGSDSRHENAAVNGVTAKSVRTAPHHAPLTPESKSSTPADGDHMRHSSIDSDSGARNGELGDHKELEHVLPATPVSNAGSHSPTQNRRGSYTREIKDEPKEIGHSDTPASNGVPAFSPQRGTYRLPPPFYPSEETSSLTSQSKMSHKEQQDSEAPQSTHKSRPSAMSLVFGGMPDSSSSSPVPFTPSSTSQYPAPPFSHLSTFTGNVNAAPFYPAVAMPPFSEAEVEVGYTPVTATATSFSPFTPSQPWLPAGAPFQYPIPAVAMPVQFGQPISPCLSQQSSAKAGHKRQDSGHESFERPVSQEQDGGVASSRPATGHESVRDSAWAEAGSPQHEAFDPTLEGYVLSQFGKFDYADCILEIYLSNDPDSPLRWPAHRLMIARSPRLASELAIGSAMPEFDHHGFRILRVWAPSRFATCPAFVEALRHLYGAPLEAQKNTPSPDSAISSPEVSRKRFWDALSRVAAGQILEIPEFAQHALDDAASLLSWDTVEQALSFALDKTHSESVSAPSYLNVGASHSPQDALSNGELDHQDSTSYGGQFLEKVLDFIMKSFPGDFSLDATAAQLTHSPRLPPSLVSSKPSVSDPRLSRIQFGDTNGEAPMEEKCVSNITSSVLLSLPFPLLDRLVGSRDLTERLGAANLAELTQSVVNERERRRLKALKVSRSSKHLHPTGNSEVWENLYWEERVEDSKLVRLQKQDEGAADTTPSK